MSTTPTPLDRADARQRATRTAWQSAAVDAAIVLVAVVAGAVLPLLGDADPITYLDPVFWGGVGVLALKTAVVTIVSYAARLRSAPAPLE